MENSPTLEDRTTSDQSRDREAAQGGVQRPGDEAAPASSARLVNPINR
jgi:hypothetical protein